MTKCRPVSLTCPLLLDVHSPLVQLETEGVRTSYGSRGPNYFGNEPATLIKSARTNAVPSYVSVYGLQDVLGDRTRPGAGIFSAI